MLQIHNLHATVGDKPILKGLSLTLLFIGVPAAAQTPAALREAAMPALLPYVQCIKQRNENVRSAEDARAFREQILNRCRPVRVRAESEARVALRRSHPSMRRQQIRANVSQTIADIESQFAPPAVPPPITHNR
jgi:hypothetical protein